MAYADTLARYGAGAGAGTGLLGGLLANALGIIDMPRKALWSELGLPESGSELVGGLTGMDPESGLAKILGIIPEMALDPINLAFPFLGAIGGAKAGARLGQTADRLASMKGFLRSQAASPEYRRAVAMSELAKEMTGAQEAALRSISGPRTLSSLAGAGGETLEQLAPLTDIGYTYSPALMQRFPQMLRGGEMTPAASRMLESPTVLKRFTPERASQLTAAGMAHQTPEGLQLLGGMRHAPATVPEVYAPVSMPGMTDVVSPREVAAWQMATGLPASAMSMPLPQAIRSVQASGRGLAGRLGRQATEAEAAATTGMGPLERYIYQKVAPAGQDIPAFSLYDPFWNPKAAEMMAAMEQARVPMTVGQRPVDWTNLDALRQMFGPEQVLPEPPPQLWDLAKEYLPFLGS